MVDDRRGARLQALQGAEHGRVVNDVEVEGAVEAPPDQLEDVGEALWGAWRGRHPPRQGRVQVMVGADQPGRRVVSWHG